jgi:hypothetical protein
LILIKIKVWIIDICKAQLVGTMHNICKIRISNPGHHKKKINDIFLTIIDIIERNANYNRYCNRFWTLATLLAHVIVLHKI